MSLNLLNGSLSGRFNNLFLSENLNIDLATAIVDRELVVQPDLSLAWVSTSAEAADALEHYQATFEDLLIDNDGYVQVNMVDNIVDPLNNINLVGGVIEIDSSLRTVFLLCVKFAFVNVGGGAAYDVTMQRKLSLNPVDGAWTDYEEYGLCCTTSVNGDEPSTQTICAQFAADSYSTDPNLNTYFRFIARKFEPTSPNVLLDGATSHATLIRLV
jgi:hypothetical protein